MVGLAEIMEWFGGGKLAEMVVAIIMLYSLAIAVALVARIFFVPKGKVIFHVFDLAPAKLLVKSIADARTMEERYELYNALIRLEAKLPAVIMDHDKTVDELLDEEFKRAREKYTLKGKIKNFIASLTVWDEEREPRYTYLRDIAHEFLRSSRRHYNT